MEHKRTRRANGDGSITPRETKTKGTVYDVQLSLKDRDTGITHRVTKRGFATQKAAIDWRSRKMREASLKLYTKPRHVMLPDVVQAYIDERDLAPSSRDNYRDALRVHIKPALNIRAEALTPKALQQFATGPGTTGRVVPTRIVRAAMRWAARPDVRMIGTNPLEGVGTKTAEEQGGRNAIPAEPLAAILAGADGQFALLWSLMVHSGIRRGEALGLNWADLDFADGTVNIASISTPESRGRSRARRTKGKRARNIPLPEELVRELKATMLRRGASPKDPVFPLEEGGSERLDFGRFYRAWDNALKAAGLPKRAYKPHELRHTFATRALAAGVPVPTLSKLLGHADSTVTMKVYAHVIAETETQAVEAVRQSLGLLSGPIASKTAAEASVTRLHPRKYRDLG